jgi:hypothetical protein
MPSGLLSDEEAWWVVLHGDFLGTYYGKYVHETLSFFLHSDTYVLG